MVRTTPLNAAHLALDASMVEFCGWQMPMHYGSQLQEHQYVREHAGMFDVSHMNVVDVDGNDSLAFLEYILANDVKKLTSPGQALYSCILNENGGVIDDLITYWQGDDRYRIVLNAATHDKDMAWLKQHASKFNIQLNEKPDLAMLAVQGPKAIELFQQATALTVDDLKAFHGRSVNEYWIARTGYTGEDGLEIILPVAAAPELWQKLLDAGVKPCGLGARDTLRLEAGMNLYGHDMDENILPFEAGLAWTLSLKDDRDFIGKAALLSAKEKGIANTFVGLILEKGGVLRDGQKVVDEEGREGVITSGSFSPTLNMAIAMAIIPKNSNAQLFVDRRGKLLPVKKVKPPFVRNGKATYKEQIISK